MSKRDQVALTDAIQQMYDINKNVVSIDPEFLADGAMDIIGFVYLKAPETREEYSHNAVWYGCNQHLRQMARAYCRGKFDPAVKAAAAAMGQGELIGEVLQDRYPVKTRKGQEPTYVLRDHLSEIDRWFNIDRMEGTARALVKHRNALETETVTLFGPRKPSDREAA